MKRRSVLGGVIGLIAASAPASAADDIARRSVLFAPGLTRLRIAGRLQGRETIDYIVSGRAGQVLDVRLVSSNVQNYFNLLPPSGETALFVGSSGGDHFKVTLTETGDYAIRVYLMRAAGRRGEVARFSVLIGLEGDAPAPVAAFDRSLSMGGVAFRVTCANAAGENVVRIVPAGLADNAAWEHKVVGIVEGAEVADLNADGSPEIYVYIREHGEQARLILLGYSVNRMKSMSMIVMPALSAPAAVGYRGHDAMAVLDGALGRRFPIFAKVGAAWEASGRMRQVAAGRGVLAARAISRGGILSRACFPTAGGVASLLARHRGETPCCSPSIATTSRPTWSCASRRGRSISNI